MTEPSQASISAVYASDKAVPTSDRSPRTPAAAGMVFIGRGGSDDASGGQYPAGGATRPPPVRFRVREELGEFRHASGLRMRDGADGLTVDGSLENLWELIFGAQ